MKVTLKYFFEIDMYEEKEFYFGEIWSGDTLIYSHSEALKCFAYKEDMVRHLQIKCAELGLEVVDEIDDTYIPSMWEEQI